MSEGGSEGRKRAGGSEGGGGGKRKKRGWFGPDSRKEKRGELCPGLRGFLVTCQGNEKAALRDAYRLLNEQRDALIEGKADAAPAPAEPDAAEPKPAEEAGTAEEEAPKKEEAVEEAEEDIATSLAAECSSLRESAAPEKRTFQQHQTGVSQLLFVACRDAGVAVGPAAEALMRRAAESKTPLSRFVLRLLPVQATVKAGADNVTKATAEALRALLAPEAGESLPKGPSFGVQFKARFSDALDRAEAQDAVADAFAAVSPLSRANLSDPDLAVHVNVVKSMALISILTHPKKLRNYNLAELAK